MQLRRLITHVADVGFLIDGHIETYLVWCRFGCHPCDIGFEEDEKTNSIELVARSDQVANIV